MGDLVTRGRRRRHPVGDRRGLVVERIEVVLEPHDPTCRLVDERTVGAAIDGDTAGMQVARHAVTESQDGSRRNGRRSHIPLRPLGTGMSWWPAPDHESDGVQSVASDDKDE